MTKVLDVTNKKNWQERLMACLDGGGKEGEWREVE